MYLFSNQCLKIIDLLYWLKWAEIECGNLSHNLNHIINANQRRNKESLNQVKSICHSQRFIPWISDCSPFLNRKHASIAPSIHRERANVVCVWKPARLGQYTEMPESMGWNVQLAENILRENEKKIARDPIKKFGWSWVNAVNY